MRKERTDMSFYWPSKKKQRETIASLTAVEVAERIRLWRLAQKNTTIVEIEEIAEDKGKNSYEMMNEKDRKVLLP